MLNLWNIFYSVWRYHQNIRDTIYNRHPRHLLHLPHPKHSCLVYLFCRQKSLGAS